MVLFPVFHQRTASRSVPGWLVLLKAYLKENIFTKKIVEVDKLTVDSIVTFCIIDICIKNNVNYQIYGIAYNLSFATIQTKEPLSTHFCVHLFMFCIFTSDYEYRLSVYSFPAGFSLPDTVQSVRRGKFSYVLLLLLYQFHYRLIHNQSSIPNILFFHLLGN